MATLKEIIITWVQFKQSWLSEALWFCWTLLKVPCKTESRKEKGNLLIDETLKVELIPSKVQKSKQRSEYTSVEVG